MGNSGTGYFCQVHRYDHLQKNSRNLYSAYNLILLGAEMV